MDKRQKTFNKELADVFTAGTIVGTATHVLMNFDKYYYLKYDEITSLDNLRNYVMMVSSLALVGILTRVYDCIVE